MRYYTLTPAEKREFDRLLDLFNKGRERLDQKETALRQRFRQPPAEKKGIEIPKEALELGEPEGIYVKVQVRKQDGSLSKRYEYVKLDE